MGVDQAVIDCPDYHGDIKQSERILFMVDGISKLGRLSLLEYGPHAPLVKGITYWGLMPFPDKEHGKYFMEDNPSVQDLTRYSENGANHGCADHDEIIEIVKRQVIANPPRPTAVNSSSSNARPEPV